MTSTKKLHVVWNTKNYITCRENIFDTWSSLFKRKNERGIWNKHNLHQSTEKMLIRSLWVMTCLFGNRNWSPWSCDRQSSRNSLCSCEVSLTCMFSYPFKTLTADPQRTSGSSGGSSPFRNDSQLLSALQRKVEEKCFEFKTVDQTGTFSPKTEKLHCSSHRHTLLVT